MFRCTTLIYCHSCFLVPCLSPTDSNCRSIKCVKIVKTYHLITAVHYWLTYAHISKTYEYFTFVNCIFTVSLQLTVVRCITCSTKQMCSKLQNCHPITCRLRARVLYLNDRWSQALQAMGGQCIDSSSRIHGRFICSSNFLTTVLGYPQ